LLGNICWTDEGPIGNVDDYVWFSARRLWVSSANFTYASRPSLEFGYWTEDEVLVGAVMAEVWAEHQQAREEWVTEIDDDS
jgi:hypothetical protein